MKSVKFFVIRSVSGMGVTLSVVRPVNGKPNPSWLGFFLFSCF